jgi:5-methylcytosine-specific restriction endonuclease McrA
MAKSKKVKIIKEKKSRKIKQSKIDGYSLDDSAKIRIACRKVWMWSYPRKLVKQRCIKEDGLFHCEQCGNVTRELKIDHINKVGDVDAGFLNRLFCPSNQLQGLCKKCHDAKTKEERKTNNFITDYKSLTEKL